LQSVKTNKQSVTKNISVHSAVHALSSLFTERVPMFGQ
jgi:hypothetical protein